jgi:cancer susceptibility candidate protein 1
LKSGAAEEKAILDIATSVRSFAYRSCKWNKTIDSDNIVIKIRENLEFDREFFEDHEPDWKYVMWWPNKVGFVRCSDDADQCDLRLAPNHETHAVLNISLQGGAVTDEAYQRSS